MFWNSEKGVFSRYGGTKLKVCVIFIVIMRQQF